MAWEDWYFDDEIERKGWTVPDRTCARCGATKDVAERYSFNVYAGRLCEACCYTYRDHCGLDQPQGNPAELEEEY